MKKFSKTEKIVIATMGDNFNAFRCEEHGVFLRRNDQTNEKCPYDCNSTVNKIDNAKELKDKFSDELF